MATLKILFICLAIPTALSRNFDRVKRQSARCICVPYYQCGDDGKIDVWGTQQIDQRIPLDGGGPDEPNPECKGVDICCELPDDDDGPPPPKTSSEIPPPVPPYQPPDDRQPPIPPIDIPSNVGSDVGEPLIPPNLEGCGLKRLNPLDPRIDTDIRITGKDDKPENTFYGEFPWMIAVFRETNGRKNFTCGGSLIKFDVVLTAAHCVASAEAYEVVVRAGDWDSRNTNEPIPHQDRKVARISIHKQFDSGNLRNDIALLFLEAPFIRTKTIDTVCIPKENSFEPINCQATGWGINSFSDRGLYQPVLKKVYLPLVDRDTCQARLRTTRLGHYFRLHKSFMCAGGQVNQDTCTGDGGGPLVCAGFEGSKFRYAQLGIVSWGIGCGKDTPAVQSSTSYFYDWIYDQL